MNPSVFLLSRLEFRKFEIESNPDFVSGKNENFFPQIDFEFNKVQFELGTELLYPDSELNDPRHFTLFLKIAIRQAKQAEGVVLPYSLSIEGAAYLHFRGKDEGLQRLKFVLGTGYGMLYSAFREHVANFTARGEHGLWFLPSPNFNNRVEIDAPKNFEKWEAAVKLAATNALKLQKKVLKKEPKSKVMLKG
jgi:hypothetical protein